jgi:tetratricopeptide (TPR) repeat protein
MVGLCLTGAAALAHAAAAEETAAALSRALAAAEAEHGDASADLLPVIHPLAQLRLRRGELQEAAALRRRALDIALRSFGRDSAATAMPIAALAEVYMAERRYLDAEPLLIAAGNLLGNETDQSRAAILAAQARIALARGDLAAAEGFARRAVEVGRRRPAPPSTETLRALGAVLTATERFAEAERVLTEALALDRERHGDGVDTGRSLSQLAHLYWREQEPERALPLIEEATAIDQRRLGPTHPFIADDFYDLALVYEQLKRPEAALRALDAAVKVLERGEGRDTLRLAYVELAQERIYRERGRPAEAEAAFRDARRILNKAEAEEHRRERQV